MAQAQPRQDQLVNSKTASVILGVSQNVIRKYTREYLPYLSLKKGRNNSYLYDHQSLETLRCIRELSLSGLTRAVIRKGLDKPGEAKVVQPFETSEIESETMVIEGGQTYPVSPGGKVLARLEQIGESLARLERENRSLRTQITGLQANQGQLNEWIRSQGFWYTIKRFFRL
jgi:DNA-binding transcriptional MerR regulator